MPPTIGAAIRCIISEPVPVPYIMGIEAREDGGDSHHFGPHAQQSALKEGLFHIQRGQLPSRGSRLFAALVPCEIEVEQHHNRRLHRHTRKGDEPHQHSHGDVKAEIPQEPNTSREGHGQRGKNDAHLDHAVERHEQHQL